MKVLFKTITTFELNMPDGTDGKELVEAIVDFVDKDDTKALDDLYIFHNMKIVDRSMDTGYWVRADEQELPVYPTYKQPEADSVERNKAKLELINHIQDSAKEINDFYKSLPYASAVLKQRGKNSTEDLVKSWKDILINRIIKDAGSAEDAGINKQGEEFNPDYDCPKCGEELDVEYRSCECGYFDEGNADLIADMRAGK